MSVVLYAALSELNLLQYEVENLRSLENDPEINAIGRCSCGLRLKIYETGLKYFEEIIRQELLEAHIEDVIPMTGRVGANKDTLGQ